MDHFAGLDVSVKDTSVCIVDDTGKIVRELKVASEPEALLAVLTSAAYLFKRIGLEAGPLSQWLVRSQIVTTHSPDRTCGMRDTLERRNRHRPGEQCWCLRRTARGLGCCYKPRIDANDFVFF